VLKWSVSLTYILNAVIKKLHSFDARWTAYKYENQWKECFDIQAQGPQKSEVPAYARFAQWLIRPWTSRIHQKLWFASLFELGSPVIDLSSVVVNTTYVLDLNCRVSTKDTPPPECVTEKLEKDPRTKKKEGWRLRKEKKVSKSCLVLAEMVRMPNICLCSVRDACSVLALTSLIVSSCDLSNLVF